MTTSGLVRLMTLLLSGLIGATGAGAAEPKWFVASLVRPAGSGPWPLVLLLHGCGGIQGNIAMWQRFFSDNGIASAAIDGFSRRGAGEICTDFRRVPVTDRIDDAYEALAALAGEPGIDAGRAAIMGFSNGAGVALEAASVRVIRRHGASPGFRAAVPLYPECKARAGIQFGIPVLIGIGERDDWTLAASCRRLVDYLVEAVEAGAHVPRLAIYAGAHHAFDTPGLATTYLPRVLNSNSASGYGATTAGDAGATELARRDVLDFLREHLR